MNCPKCKVRAQVTYTAPMEIGGMTGTTRIRTCPRCERKFATLELKREVMGEAVKLLAALGAYMEELKQDE